MGPAHGITIKAVQNCQGVGVGEWDGNLHDGLGPVSNGGCEI